MLYQRDTYQVDVISQQFGRGVNPSVCQYAVAPCKKRPDSLQQCALIVWDKRNNVCSTCQYRDVDKKVYRSHEDIVYMLAEGLVYLIRDEDPSPGVIRNTKRQYTTPIPAKDCQWPECDKKTKGEYCERHKRVVTSREYTWHKHYGYESKPPPEFIYRPVEKWGGKEEEA